jgi:fucose 4-O-acetylase-like acetyltransferase
MDIFNSAAILNKKRWVFIDSDKGISIILVGFGHCLSVLDNHGLALDSYPTVKYISVFLYGFRMPLFFIISGIFVSSSLKKKQVQGYVADRVNTILYPLAIWGFIEVTFQLITSKYTNNGITAMNYLNLFVDARKTGHFWYLNTLFFIGVIYAILKAKLHLKPIVQVGLGLIMYCFSSYIHLNNLNAALFTDICEFYIFFALGDLMSNIILKKENVDRFSSLKIFFPLFAVFLVMQYQFAEYNIHGGTEGINYVEHKMPFFFLIEALIGCAISINVSFLLQKYNLFKFLRVIGFHSLFIYCMQIIVMTMSRVVMVNILNITHVPSLIIVIWAAGIVLPMLFYNICMHYNVWWLFTYKKPVYQQIVYAPPTDLEIEALINPETTIH